MYAVTVPEPGRLAWRPAPAPVARPGEIIIDIAAAGVNRADLLQAAGRYPPPPGASQILGLECAGTVAESGDGPFRVGEPVCALLTGGGYAERVAVPHTAVLPVPRGLSLVQAAALPEVACTVWSNLVMTAGLRAGETVLIHGGSSGIGTMAIQVARLLGARVAVTASTDEKLAACADLGAEILIDYRKEDFVARLAEATGGRGADIILDVVGGEYLGRNVRALADGGRLVIIGLMGGARAELDIGALLAKRGSVTGTTLRTRPDTGPGSKAEVVAEVQRRLWPEIAAGRIRPVIDRTLPMDEAGEAHRLLRAGEVLGKVVLIRP